MQNGVGSPSRLLLGMYVVVDINIDAADVLKGAKASMAGLSVSRLYI